MSMLRFFPASFGKISYLPEPEISPLTLEHLKTFAAEIKKISLTEKQEQELNRLLTTNEHYVHLAELIDSFLRIKDSIQAFPGLTNNEIQQLKKSIKAKKLFREANAKNQMQTEDYKDFIKNEEKIIPLEQMTRWWAIHLESFTKEKLWEEIALLAIKENIAKKQTEPVIIERLNKLNALLTEWTNHHIFAGYSSENLSIFYSEYLLIIENCIHDELKKSPPIQSILHAYLERTFNIIKKLKAQAIYSMLNRLQCAEYYEDMECDDLILFLRDRIDTTCNMKIPQTGKKPTQRHSLSAELFTTFSEEIAVYCKQNPEDKALQNKFAQLQTQMCLKKINLENKFSANTFALVTLPKLLEKASKQSDLVQTLFTSDQTQEPSFILNKIVKIADQCDFSREEGQGVKQRYLSFWADLKNHLISELQKKVEAIIERVFSQHALDINQIKKTLAIIKLTNKYFKKYLNIHFLETADIILLLAMRLKTIIAQGHTISNDQCQRILQLFSLLHNRNNPIAKKKLAKKISGLPQFILKLKDKSSLESLQSLICYFTITPLKSRELLANLYRQHYLANLYGQPWDDHTDHFNIPYKAGLKIDYLLSYLKNVGVNQIRLEECRNLSHFLKNSWLKMLAKYEKLVTPQNPFFRDKPITCYKVKFDTLKIEFENEIANKLNDAFLIKQYLFSEKSHKIKIKKLNRFLTGLHSFFNDISMKNKILENITQVILSALKMHCLASIKNKACPDFNYISHLHESAGQNLFKRLCKDEELRKILARYIETYDGSETHLSRLLSEMTPAYAPCDCEKLICLYAKKRLEHIKFTQEVTESDYHFFAHYTSLEQISNYLKEYKFHFQNQIQTICCESTTGWNQKMAKLIEFFGDQKAVAAYRVKRLNELLFNAENQSLTDQKAKQVFDEWMATVYHERFIHHPNDDSLPENKNNPIHELLDKAIDNKNWSLLLELVVCRLGTQEQIHRLHYHCLSCYLMNHEDFSESWLGKTFQQQFSVPPDAQKKFYLDFFGENYCNKIYLRIQHSLSELAAYQENSSIHTHHYEYLKKIVNCIGPLHSFIHLYGSQAMKDLLLKLSLLKNKNSFLALGKNANKNMTVNLEIILACFKKIESVDFEKLTSLEKISNFLIYLENEIFNKLDAVLSQENLTYNELSLLRNIFYALVTNQLKLLLINACKTNIQTNPYWLSLINHLDELNYLDNLETTLSNLKSPALQEKGFVQLLNFAKRLSHLKQATQAKLRCYFFNEAGITGSHVTSSNLSYLLKSSKINNQQLIKLWSLYANKLKQSNLHSEIKVAYLTSLISKLLKISEEIWEHSRADSRLLTKLINLFRVIPDITQSVIALANPPKKTLSSSKSIWVTVTEADKILRPIFKVRETTCLMHCLQLIEHYITKKFNSEKLKAFQQICMEFEFQAKSDYNSKNVELIKDTFTIKNEIDIIKVLNTMKIYRQLMDVAKKRKPIQTLPGLLDEIIKSSPFEIAGLSSHYNSLLSELRNIYSNHFSAKNDSLFPVKEKKPFYSLKE